jgi:4-carboxymuconolactone decarboxylase
LNNGVTPVEASGVLTHLALHAGWPSAVSALEVYDQVYTARNVDFAALQAAVPALPPAALDAAGAQSVTAQFGTVAPKFAELTNRVVFGDLWLRSDLGVRDRSLVTIAALAAMGDADLLDPYLRRGVDAGLTRDEIAEAVTHLAFYVGWGKATKALAAVIRTLGA